MAQRQVTVYIDDLTGKELAQGTAETVRFSLDGVNYELDTDIKAAEKLRSALERYVSAGRRAGASRPVPTRRIKAAPSSSAVRVWAAANGVAVSSRGRIPAAVLAQFEAAGN